MNWNLARYFYDSLTDPRIDADIATWRPITETFAERYRGKIRAFTTPEEVLEYYEYNESLAMVGKKTMHYLSYLSALETQNTDVQKKLGELEYLGIQLGELTLFIDQEWRELGEEQIRAFAESTLLAPYRNDLIERADTLKYLLDEPVERALNKKSRALGILGLHEELRSSLTFRWTEGDETKDLTEEEIRAFVRSPDREKRRQATESMRDVYLVHQHQIVFGNLYTSIVKNWATSQELRGYATVMSKRNVSEQMPDRVVDRLMVEVQKMYPLYQRFLRAKQRHMGLETFYGYDTNAPIHEISKRVEYAEACEMVTGMFASFDPRFGDYAKSMIDEERIDALPKAGKRGGAFASYDKGVESFVLLNYTNTIDDVFTLAHELGHAIHGHLAQSQPSCVYDSPLVLAETASIFAEALLMKRVQATLKPEEQKELLNQKLMDMFGSIHRQIMYVSFERRVHEHIAQGGELTYRELNLWWDEESHKLSGDAITSILPPEKNYTWSAIPHIFGSPFYCYAYSFGMLVTLALVSRYEREGDVMIPDYVRLLSTG